jgi:hypothetical protein
MNASLFSDANRWITAQRIEGCGGINLSDYNRGGTFDKRI